MVSKQVKSRERTQKFGEVFTNEREVKAMCDLIPQEIWQNIESTFLEPACGEGAFLVEIYARKLKYCKTEKDGLKALSSIVGIELLPDNCAIARLRLVEMFVEHFHEANDFSRLCALAIANNNIICGESLSIQQKWIEENQMRNPTVKVGKNGQMTLFE